MRFSLSKRPLNLKNISVCLLLFLSIVTLLSSSAYAAKFFANEQRFFSYERLIINQRAVDTLSGDGRTQRDLKEFTTSYMNGINAIEIGNLEVAKKDLLKARDIWPEYFSTDFLLALIYEKEGNYKTAARYYKSYLKKLKGFHEGQYRISGPMINSLALYGIEKYEPAHTLIKRRLERHGINVDKVRQPFRVPAFFLLFLLVLCIAGIYAGVYYKLLPYIKKQYRIKNPPEGFWVCPKCGTTNPDPAKECEKCRRLRKQ